MSIDGLFIASLAHEISLHILGGRIDRVSMPDRFRAMISIRQPGSSHVLVASIHPQWPRLSLTHQDFDNPETPPVFCSVLRKHILGGRIRAIRQPGLERLLAVQIECRDEHGRRSLKDLVIEIMGKHSNMLLLDSDSSVIIDCAKHITSRVNRYRELLPHRRYVLPPSQGKTDLARIQGLSIDHVSSALRTIESNRSARNQIVETLQGFGPLTAAEVLFRSGIDPDLCWSELDEHSRERAARAILDLVDSVLAGTATPCAYSATDGGQTRLLAFSFTTLAHLLRKGCHEGCHERVFPMLADLLDFALSERETSARVLALKSQLASVLSANMRRTETKLAKQTSSLQAAENAGELKLRADLLMAHGGAPDRGCRTARVVDYFDPGLPLVEIELDPGLTLVDNAQRYYELYAKAKRSKDVLQALVKSTVRDLTYLRQVELGLLCSSTLAELEEIRSELAEQGFIKSFDVRRTKPSDCRSAPAEFVSVDGVRILVGKNNRQNDQLTLKLASQEDIWLHVKDLPGSHVIVRRKGLKAVPDSTMTAAALLAAYYSKARDSSGVPVDYTLRRHVRKPQGAKPGMVIYDSQSTVYVTPSRDALERYLADTSQLV